MRGAVLCAAAATALGAELESSVPEPYPWLNSGAFSGPVVPQSVDPLVSYQWNANADYSKMQIYAQAPSRVAAAPAGAATGLDTLIASSYGNGSAIVTGSATIMITFASELAAWLEFSIPGGLPACASIKAAISEYNTPRPGGSIAPTYYGGPQGEFRVETNKQLYDGLRYAWLFVTSQPGCAPLSFTGVRAVAQVLPLNYTGSFASGDAELDRIFYTGAYATRVNILPGFFGSELYDRSDRSPPFQGDAHVAQAVGLTAFFSLPMSLLVLQMINFTDSAVRPVHDSNIATYPLMWVLSVVDYYTLSNDKDSFAFFADDVSTILDQNIPNFQTSNPADMRWSGWDDRLGSGFVNVDQTPEARRFYWTTILRATARFAAAAATGGGALKPYATKYQQQTQALLAKLRAPGPDWWQSQGYGLHASAAAINSGMMTSDEQAGMFAALFNDSAHICSLSNYDSGFILDALAEMGHIDYGTAMLRLCWGKQLSAGSSCWWESTAFYDGMLSGPPGGDQDLLPGATTSSCHAWGSHPTVWMRKHLLGLQESVAAPGWQQFIFAPAVGLTKTTSDSDVSTSSGSILPRVAGQQNTPHGLILASAEVASSSSVADDAAAAAHVLTMKLAHPVGTSARAIVPVQLPSSDVSCQPAITSLSVTSPDGDTLLDASFATSAGHDLQTYQVKLTTSPLGKQLIEVPASLLPGAGSDVSRSYVINATYAGSAFCLRKAAAPADADSDAAPWPYAPFGPPVWPALAPLAIDNSTTGAGWLGKYGSDGYVLLGYDQNGGGRNPPSDRTKLPPYISSVAVSTPQRVRYGQTDPAGTINPAAFLPDPANPGGAKGLGAAWVGDNSLFSLFLDVNFQPSSPGSSAAGEKAANKNSEAPTLGGNPIYSLWLDINATNGDGSSSGSDVSAPRSLLRGAAPSNDASILTSAAPSAFKVTVYVADTIGQGNATDPQGAESVVLRAEDLVTRNALLPDAMVRHYVPPPAYGGVVPPWNAQGNWGLERGIYLTVAYNASLRLRLYCNGGCYASASAVFFDPA